MKSKKEIDKQINRILKRKFYIEPSLNPLSHRHICTVFNSTKYEKLWDKYWLKINTRKDSFMTGYFDNMIELTLFNEKASLLRLSVVEEFKKYCIGKI